MTIREMFSKNERVFYVTNEGENVLYEVQRFLSDTTATIAKIDQFGAAGKKTFSAPMSRLLKIWLQPDDEVINKKSGYRQAKVISCQSGINNVTNEWEVRFELQYAGGTVEFIKFDQAVESLDLVPQPFDDGQ